MFRNRNTTQKPSDELVATFKASFPHLRTTEPSEENSLTSTSLADALDIASTSRHPDAEDDAKEVEPTSRGEGTDQWRFTPSMLDPNSFAFSNFANQPPGYYTPTPGGTNTLYHPQAGDLHTPGFSLGIGTPLSMPTSDGVFQSSHPAHAPMSNFHSTGVAPQMFQNTDPFAFHHAQPNAHPHHHGHHHSVDLGRPQQFHSAQPHHMHQSPVTYAPHSFSSQHPPFGHFEGHMGEAKSVEHEIMPMSHRASIIEHSPILQAPFTPSHDDTTSRLMQQSSQHPTEQYRYHVTLNAPTAMIKSSDEIPITYLNKGQAYTIAVTDTKAQQFATAGAQYRTYVRVSFEDEQQRQRPAACWQLWKEGRGTNEAHHRGGRLQAVEFVDPGQTGAADSHSKPQPELEYASFDGFSVLWTPSMGGPVECCITVRFNFLSTDFSHSKGVKGIPVRLCTKTELKSVALDPHLEGSQPEVCYCKVKLFRDHGAERKLSNDVAHVKKSIDKLKQQIQQAEAGIKDSGKRKRSNSISKSGSANPRPTKVPKHKRTWSMSSEASASGGQRGSHEEDLSAKLQALQDMFTSTRPSSVLYLKGDDLDDPDLHPVQLSGDPPDLLKVETGDSSNLGLARQDSSASNISPTPSSLSMSVPATDRRTSDFPRSTFNPPSRVTSDEWASLGQTATADLPPATDASFASPSAFQKISRRSTAGSSSSWIDASGVDPSYRPPPERVIKPVACFYFRLLSQPSKSLQPHQPVQSGADDKLYRAVYLMQRTLNDLVYHIATKSKIEPSKILQTHRINKKGLEILVDNEMVMEMPEGQDFGVDFTEIVTEEPVKQEWSSGLPEVLVDGDIDSAQTTSISGYALRLHY